MGRSPIDRDGGGKVNDLRNFECHDGWGKAHIVISRTGELLLAHDYSIPWRETKFEQAAEFGGALKGLFLHNEMIQPRRSAPGRAIAVTAKTVADLRALTAWPDGLALNIHVDLDPRFSVVKVKRAS